ncbi:MAG TPA: hypothetical protein VEZ55_04730 [Chitinophagaceae bacterium]|jgi:hypothetical protein|nr:hypothetical protein [Chitinophagaceae bacterium]
MKLLALLELIKANNGELKRLYPYDCNIGDNSISKSQLCYLVCEEYIHEVETDGFYKTLRLTDKAKEVLERAEV